MPIAPSDARPTARGRRETRLRILEAATAVFSELGFERATMKEVASRCGLTDAAIYYYFGSKNELLEAALLHRSPRPTAAPQREAEAGAPSWERLLAAVDALLEDIAANEAAIKLLSVQAFAIPFAREALGQYTDTAREELARLFNGWFAPGDAATFTDAVLYVINGAVHLARGRRSPPLPDALREQAFRDFVHEAIKVCIPLDDGRRSMPAG